MFLELMWALKQQWRTETGQCKSGRWMENKWTGSSVQGYSAELPRKWLGFFSDRTRIGFSFTQPPHSMADIL